jgi:hypothetical protein
MDMHRRRTLPALAAAATGATLFMSYVAIYGLDADLAASSGALASLIATFVGPGVAGALASAWQARRPSRRLVVTGAVAPAVAPATAPYMAAEAVADIRSLTEERVSRARRAARGDRRTAALAS